MKKRVHIAAGIILSADQQEVFLTRREAKAYQGGFWEFAGGKVEQGESAEQAVVRELEEEVGIQVTALMPFYALEHDYPDKALKFDFFLVTEFDGHPFGKEGQEHTWARVEALRDFEFPQANHVVIEALLQRKG
ncbi:8-oxo-dGTP diphosphatase MutT [Thaumasiovibrio subtropicus]